MEEKLISGLLKKAMDSGREDMAEFVGVTIELQSPEFKTCKAFDEFGETFNSEAVAIGLDVSGKFVGQSAFVVDPRVAIYLGCKLLMIPEEEINSRLKVKSVDEEIVDAFGEIANVAIGAMSNIFETNKKVDIKFKKGQVEVLDPLSIDADDLPSGAESVGFYKGEIFSDGKSLGPISFYLPVSAFAVEVPVEAKDETPAEASPQVAAPVEPAPPEGTESEVEEAKSAAQPTASPSSQPEVKEGSSVSEKESSPPSVSESERGVFASQEYVVIVKASDESVKFIEEVVKAHGKQSMILGVDDDIRAEIAGKDIPLFMLVLDKVTPQGLSHVIRMKTFLPSRSSLVVCAPGWTRSLVAEAVTYGTSDILLLPAESKHIDPLINKYTT